MRERARFEREIKDLDIESEIPAPSAIPSSSSTTNKIPIIFVPGGMGTELKTGQTILWPTVSANFLNLMEMTPEGKDITREEITTGEVIRTFPLLDVGVAGITDKFFEFFVNHGYKENVDLFPFPYDWRKDIDKTARELASKVKEISAISPNKKVIIITYSNGGLIAFSYLSDISSHYLVEKIILLAPPIHGMPKYLGTLMFGKNFPPFGVRRVDLSRAITDECVKKMVKNMPALYQGAMDEWYESFIGGSLIKDVGNNSSIRLRNLSSRFPNEYNNDLIIKALDFHKKLDNAWQSNPFKETYLLVGSSLETITQIILDNGRLKEQKLQKSGDETVPSVSLENILPKVSTRQRMASDTYPDGKLEIFSTNDVKLLFVFSNMTHGSIVKDNYVLQWVMKIINNNNIPASPLLPFPNPKPNHPRTLPAWDLRNRTQGGRGPLYKYDTTSKEESTIKLVKLLQEMLKELGSDSWALRCRWQIWR